jgi:hypothetical protein
MIFALNMSHNEAEIMIRESFRWRSVSMTGALLPLLVAVENVQGQLMTSDIPLTTAGPTSTGSVGPTVGTDAIIATYGYRRNIRAYKFPIPSIIIGRCLASTFSVSDHNANFSSFVVTSISTS